MFKVGDVVLFGKPNGQRTLGRIVKENELTYVVCTLEGRYRRDFWKTKYHPDTRKKYFERAGDFWRVQKPYVVEAPLPSFNGRLRWANTI